MDGSERETSAVRSAEHRVGVPDAYRGGVLLMESLMRFMQSSDRMRPEGTGSGEVAGDDTIVRWQSRGTANAVSVLAHPANAIARAAGTRTTTGFRMASPP